MPRGRHPRPRRKRYNGEVWHKGKGPHGPSLVHWLCLRCTRAVSKCGWKRHIRACIGLVLCHVCLGPFPCERPSCPWGAAYLLDAPPVVPASYVHWFQRLLRDHFRSEYLPTHVQAWLLATRKAFR